MAKSSDCWVHAEIPILRKEKVMSAESKKGYGLTIVMMILGLLALYGALYLIVIIPAAALVWFGAGRHTLWKSRN
jgi:hypothetical protein